MITSDQIQDLRQRIDTLRSCLDIETRRQQVAELQKKTEAADFWSDPKAAETFLKSMNGIKAWVTGFDAAVSAADDLDVLYEFARESVSGTQAAAKPKEYRAVSQAASAANRKASV